MEKQRTLGIDYGVTQYGLALSSKYTNYISPLNPLRATKGIVQSYMLDTVIYKYGITQIVIGWPEDLLNRPPTCGDLILDLAKCIKARHPFCTVHFINEKYTSREAKRQISSRKESIDSIAACIILGDFVQKS